MASMFSMSFDTRPLAAFVSQLRATAGPVVIARAINKTADSEKVAFSRDIAKKMALKVGVVKNAIRVERATGSRQAARVITAGARIPLIDFGARGQEPSRGRGRGVSARLPGGRGRYPHAFIATMRSGHRGVFERVPGGRRHGLPPNRSQLPIYELFGPSITRVFERLIPASDARRTETLLKNLQHEFQFALSKAS